MVAAISGEPLVDGGIDMEIDFSPGAQVQLELDAVSGSVIAGIACALCRWPEATKETPFCSVCLPHVEPAATGAA